MLHLVLTQSRKAPYGLFESVHTALAGIMTVEMLTSSVLVTGVLLT